MTPDQITQMATLAGARPGFDNQADLSFLQDFAALVADAATAPLHTRIAELEAQLYAVGAGGVGQSIKPQVQADAAQEPVAWRVRPFNYGIGHEGVDALTTRKEQCEMWERKGWKVEPLYAAPLPPAAPQEPVAWLYEWSGRTHITTADQRPIEHAHPHFNKSKPLYTAPQPARQPLTDEQILSIVRVAPALDTAEAEWLHVARAIEAAHGITGSQK